MKKQEGISLITLIATIIILLILTATIIVNYDSRSQYSNYRNMCADIEMLKDKILTYYNKYEEIPKTGEAINVSNINVKDGETGNFYEIDLNKISILTLNYGTKQVQEDIYIINENSLNIYYLKGIEYKDHIAYTIE